MSKHPLYNTTGLQKNNKSHVLYALANKQMELQKLQEEYNTKIAKLKSDLSALETTICLFDEDCEETIAKISSKTSNRGTRKRHSYFGRGEAKKLILTTLRTYDKPLKTSEVSLSCQNAKNIDNNNHAINKAIQKTVILSLRELEEKNLVEAIGKDGLSVIWKIKD